MFALVRRRDREGADIGPAPRGDAGPRRSVMRARWAAIGAAVAVALGSGAGIGWVAASSSAPSSSAPSSFVSITPVRILDTRSNLGLTGPFVSATGRDLQVTGTVATSGGPAVVVPSGATAVSLNVTVVRPSAAGFVAVRPAGTPGAPQTSSLNFPAGGVVPNAVTVALSPGGAVQIVYDASGQVGPSTNVLVDVVGYFVAGGGSAGPTGPAGPAGPPGPAGPGLSGPLATPRAALTTGSNVPVESTTWVTVAQHPLVVPTAICPAGTTPRHQFSVVADATMRSRGAGADLFVNVEVMLALDDPANRIAATLTEAAARSAGAAPGARFSRVPVSTQYVFEISGSGGTHTVYLQGRLGTVQSMLADALQPRVRSVHEGYTCS